MHNLLRAQFYKLFHKKSFYAILGIAFLITFTVICMYWVVLNGPGSADKLPVISGYNWFYYGIGGGGIEIFEILGIVLVALFTASEFKQGTLRLTASYGFRRRDIYLSNLISSFVAVSAVTAVMMLAGLVFGSVFFGFGSPLNFQILMRMLRSFALTLLVSSAFSSIYVLISILFKETGIIIGVYTGFTVLVSNLLVAQLAMRYDWAKRLSEYMLQGQLCNVSSCEITIKTALTACLYSIAVIIASSLAGCFYFKQTDIT